MSATEDTSRLFRAMGLERKAGDYKDIGPLTRTGRIAAFDESALPMMAAVARSLDAGPAEPAAPSVPAFMPVSAPAPALAEVIAARAERMSPLMASLTPPAPAEAEPPAQREAAASVAPVPVSAPSPSPGISALSRVFERYAASPVEAVPAAPAAGTPLKPLFDRLR
ncbi:hypothetical protein [Zavarzinia aquatilis]|nr:hypothetical protein [Zavarzinia aquatilis]